MKQFMHILSIILIFSILSSCAEYHLLNKESVPKTIKTEVTITSMWWGNMSGELKMHKNFCEGERVHDFRLKRTFLQSAATIFTIGIYNPMTIEWSCYVKPTDVGEQQP